MNKALKYSIIIGGVLFGAYATYLIYTSFHNAIIDAKVVSIDEANKTLDNI
jgi:hypothetical protein